MPTSIELGQKLDTERRQFAVWLDQHKTEDGGYKAASDFLEEFNTRNKTLSEMQDQYSQAVTVEKAAADNAAILAGQGRIVRPESGDAPVSKTITSAEGLDRAFKSAFTENADALKAIASGDLSKGFPRFELPIEGKTLVTLSMHYPPAERLATAGSALYYNSVEDLFMPGSTASNNVEGFIQTTDTDNTAAVAEGSAATDSAFAWTKTTDEVETIQAWIPVTREALSDNAQLQSIITGYLAARLDKYVSKQLMYGTGTTPEIWGCSVRTGVQTQAKGTDPVFDAVMKAITLVTVTGDTTPDAIVFHPTDWQNIVLTRTSDGVYILGNPGSMPSPALWGLPVRVSSTVAATAGTAVVGGFKTAAQVFSNGGVVVETSTEHSTYFTERKVALAISRRLAAFHYRPSGFCKVTGL